MARSSPDIRGVYAARRAQRHLSRVASLSLPLQPISKNVPGSDDPTLDALTNNKLSSSYFSLLEEQVAKIEGRSRAF